MPTPRARLAAAVMVRGAGFLALWMMLSGPGLGDLPGGVIAAVAAAWASLCLLPPSPRRTRPAALARLAFRFGGQSVVAGADVAWRALAPSLPVRPGFARYSAHLPVGPARDAFCMLTSLVPGTVPAGTDESGALVVHCLDVTQPIAAQLAAEETALAHAFGQTTRS